MNFNIKQVLPLGTIASLSTIGLISCDSGDSSPPLQTSSAVLASTVPSESEVLPGDSITYITNDFTQPFLPALTFQGNPSTIGESQYEYAKTGAFTFEIKVEFNAPESLNIAVARLVSGDLSNPLSSRIRDLLLRPLPDEDSGIPLYTPNELRELVSALNGVGANLQLNEDETGLRVPTDQTYRHLVTSDVRNRNRGTMGGGYVLESNGSNIIFRPVSSTDPSFRFFANGLIPVLSTTTFRDTRDEIGTFNIEFINPPSSGGL